MAHTLVTHDPATLCAARASLQLAPGEVHVWAFHLGTSAECRANCRESLAPAEEARADRFVVAQDRDDFVVARGVLRHLLARYTGSAPCDLEFRLTAEGKPGLAARGAALSFNLSHAHSRALIAISDGREIGIDLEQTGNTVRALAIAQRHFAPAERAAVEGAAAQELGRVFFRYWVAKEAVLKAQGVGLRFPIDEFEVRFDPTFATARILIAANSRLHADWMIRMLPVGENWAAAVAARGNEWTLRSADTALVADGHLLQ